MQIIITYFTIFSSCFLLSVTPKPDNCKCLDLSNQCLLYFPDLSMMTDVECLDLSNNKLNVLYWDRLPPFLKELDLSNNRIKLDTLSKAGTYTLDQYKISSAPPLKKLDLSNNLLASFSFSTNQQFEGGLFYRRYNSTDSTFSSPNNYYGQLKYLDISNNNLTTLVLNGNIKLDYLDISGNTNLVNNQFSTDFWSTVPKDSLFIDGIKFNSGTKVLAVDSTK